MPHSSENLLYFLVYSWLEPNLSTTVFSIRIDMKTEIWVKPKKILGFLLIINLSLALFSLLLCSLEEIFPDKFILLHIIAKLFSSDGERNIPAFYSSAILVISSILFAIIFILKYQLKSRFASHWIVLATIFSLMA